MQQSKYIARSKYVSVVLQKITHVTCYACYSLKFWPTLLMSFVPILLEPEINIVIYIHTWLLLINIYLCGHIVQSCNIFLFYSRRVFVELGTLEHVSYQCVLLLSNSSPMKKNIDCFYDEISEHCIFLSFWYFLHQYLPTHFPLNASKTSV